MEDFLQQIQAQGGDETTEQGKQNSHYLDSVYGEQDADPAADAGAPDMGADAPMADDQMVDPAAGEPMGDEAMGAPAAAVGDVAEGQIPVEEQQDNEVLSEAEGDDMDPAAAAPEMGADDSVNPIEGTMGDAMQGGDGSYLKQQMMQVLEGFKKDKEFIEGLQTAQPEAYHETIALLHQMIKTAKILNAAQPAPADDTGAPDMGDDEMDNGGPIGDAMDAADSEEAPPAEGEDAEAAPAEGEDKPFPPKKDGDKPAPKKDDKSDSKDGKKDSDKDGVPAKKDADDKDKKKPFPNAGEKKDDKKSDDKKSDDKKKDDK
jgi:hypothetical protein